MSRRFFPALAALTLLLVPLVVAEPIATHGTGTLRMRWTGGAIEGYCPKQLVSIATMQVNARLLVDIQSSTHGVGGSGTSTNCGLLLVAAGGVYVNPCQLVAGTAAPALTMDPYFTRDAFGDWTKTIHFTDGGFMNLLVTKDFRGTWGNCASSGVIGHWDGPYQAVRV